MSPKSKVQSPKSKTWRIVLCALAMVCLFAVKSAGQIFVGGIGCTNGTTNAQVQVNLVPQTNSFTFTLIPRTFQIQNIATNENISVTYGVTLVGFGNTNQQILGSNWYVFSNWLGFVNGQTVTTNIGAVNATVQVIPWGNATVNSGSNILLLQ